LCWFHFVCLVHLLLIVPIYLMTIKTHLMIMPISLPTLPIILMVVWILLMIEWILLLIQPICDTSFVNFYIPNLVLLQLLLICKLKIRNMFTFGSMICFLSSSFFICRFCMTSFIVFLYVNFRLLNSTCILFLIYWHLLLFFLNFRFHVFTRFELIQG